MPNFSGVWDLKDQVQAIAAGRWTGVPTFELYAWGENGSGQLGNNETANQSSPVQIGVLQNWFQVSAGTEHTTSVKDDGTLWAWGSGSNGRLGDGTIDNKSSPIQIGALTGWSQVSSGRFHTAAVKTDGTLWTWGGNSFGRLGDNTIVNKSSPIQVGALTTWSQVSAGALQTAAIKTDNTLWIWGGNAEGQLGQGNTINRSSPVQVGLLTDWAQVACGKHAGTNGEHIAAVKTDGTLWAWGENVDGELGDNTNILRSSPVQIGLLTNWYQVSAGSDHTAAVKTDGTLWTWGSNLNGQLGLLAGAPVFRSSPVQVGALTTWSQVSAGGEHTASVKTDGTLWTWGLGADGQLGNNSTTRRSSPVQVGSLTSWSQVSAGGESSATSPAHTVAILQGTSN